MDEQYGKEQEPRKTESKSLQPKIIEIYPLSITNELKSIRNFYTIIKIKQNKNYDKKFIKDFFYLNI